VLSHEIGHALVFISSVDSNSPQQPTVLDLFRYSDESIQTGKEAGLGPIPDLSRDDRPKYAFDWSNSNIEDCINGSSGKFSFCGEIEFSHGLGTVDDRQASHFLDNKPFDSGAKPFPAICDFNVCFDTVTQSWVTRGNLFVPSRQSTNVMDPTTGRSDINSLTGGDYWIFDLLGYEFEGPPFTLSSLGGMSGGYNALGDNQCLQFDGHICTRSTWDDPYWNQTGLSVTQQGTLTRTIIKSRGLVTAISTIPPGTFGLDWSMTDSNLVNQDSYSATFTFDPSGLNAGIYNIVLAITDNAGLSLKYRVMVSVVNDLIILTDKDEDGDGISDKDEGFGDSDGDGIPDYKDDNNLPANVLQITGARLMQTEAGLSLKLGESAFVASAMASISQQDIGMGGAGGTVPTADDEFLYHSEIVDFVISGLSQPGDLANVVIQLDKAMPENSVYRKFISGQGWVTLLPGSGYLIMSASSINNVCPDVNGSQYKSGLNQGDDCLKLTLVDGGAFDGDGEKDGGISDPGVVAVEKAPTTPTPTPTPNPNPNPNH
jgi:hypothetical protein